ncbi:AMP-dependent synthetase/ligase [Bifidobacterium bifidum]|uniref:AMP-dependent synthetase/ligase n=1 Tax=Bifidobacterium bifidum TaxID=1681 RepID=UPI000641C68E|nr:AMP-dependent synthetase/ligase [Bifidobacterium bifidum]MDB1198668.1 AMP-dependent synthetase/ligase [Bifidobacterium bifidum]MDB1200724.1 AMP-dependent synthetase/ligase [Bifidobacterium bifidum]MDB1204332.1 AMP-dependent synthetase/ligase [Bifidobacterium bifidum]MDB1205588.1 AMP-dependent synthetase/ligase [Bifidobacterium bifidum]MDB1207310.1 AMP-dependent synthetase/ligase [Bifidobacterium bifidum]
MISEYTSPGDVTVNDDETLYSLLTERIDRTGNATTIAARKTGPGAWSSITTGEFHRLVLAAAKGLIAFGVGKGDAVTLFSATRFEWGVLDFALAAIGAVNVPVYDTDSAAQAERIINDSGVKLAVTDNRERYDRLDSINDRCPGLQRILMMDGNALGALEGLGVSVSDEELEARIADTHADDLATIVYTSGSTGAPKGVELTHRNFLSVVRAGYECLGEVLCDNHPRLLLFLPLAHCFARFIQYCSIGSDDGVVGYLPDTKSLLPDLRSFKPTYLLGVPRVFEKVYNAASRKAGTGFKGRIFAQAAQCAREWSRTEQDGGKHSASQRARHAMFETSVYRAVRGALGPNIRYVACGGAPLSADLAHFFAGIGLPMIQGYGMTETAAPFTVTRVNDNKIGTVGQPAPGSSVRIADDGEVQVRGANVFRGYHNLPEKTAETFTADGWLKTGDLGSLDEDGRLTITGRKKDIIITAGGKNVSPIPMEEEIAKCPIVEHAVVVGDGRPFIGALVTLDPEGLASWLPTIGQPADLSLADAAALPQVREEIQPFVDRANATVSRAESVRKFVVLDAQFTQENSCLTPSLKVVRPAVNRVFSGAIDQELYAGKR